LEEIEPDNVESTHSFEDSADEFFNNCEHESEDNYEFWITPDDTRKEVRLAEEVTIKDCLIDRSLLAFHGLDKHPQPQICLHRVESQVTLSKSKKLKRLLGTQNRY